MAKISWTNEAQIRLRDIHRYIAQDNPSAADRVVGGIFEKAQILTAFPYVGYKYRTELKVDIRILLYGHYRIAYLTKKTIGLIFSVSFMALLTWTSIFHRSRRELEHVTIRRTEHC